MEDRDETKEQLINELESLRRGVYELEESQARLKGTEGLLRESEERFRLLYENAPLAYQSLDENGHFLEVNQAWLDTLGYSRNEVMGKWCGDFLTAPYREKFTSYFPQFKEVGRIQGIEFEMVKKDGSTIFIMVDGKIGHDRQGQFKQTHCISHDITERKREEEQLRKRELEFRTLAENLPDIIARFDREGRYVYLSSTMERVLGIPAQEFVGKVIGQTGIAQRTRPDLGSAQFLLATVRRVWETDSAQEIEIAWPLPDGEHVFECRIVPEHYPTGEISGVLGIGRDITERKRAEERLRLLDFALDHVREAAFLTDENARFQFVNEESCRILGYTRSELLGLSVSDVDPDFPMDRWLSHWNDLKTQGSLIFESRHKTRDGRIFPVEINANYFEYGGQSYNLALIRDITERKQAEQEHLANLRFFESTDRVNRAIQGTNDLEQMMSDFSTSCCRFSIATGRFSCTHVIPERLHGRHRWKEPSLNIPGYSLWGLRCLWTRKLRRRCASCWTLTVP